jgi:hypothetical protein
MVYRSPRNESRGTIPECIPEEEEETTSKKCLHSYIVVYHSTLVAQIDFLYDGFGAHSFSHDDRTLGSVMAAVIS